MINSEDIEEIKVVLDNDSLIQLLKNGYIGFFPIKGKYSVNIHLKLKD